jgi:hypothetical protein
MSKQKPEKTMTKIPKIIAGTRRSYKAPRLTIYGDLRQLTAGGSKSGNEVKGGLNTMT